MIVVAQWLRIWVFSIEVPGLNTGKIFPDIFHAHFCPIVTDPLEYFDPVIYSCLGFAL